MKICTQVESIISTVSLSSATEVYLCWMVNNKTNNNNSEWYECNDRSCYYRCNIKKKFQFIDPVFYQSCVYLFWNNWLSQYFPISKKTKTNWKLLLSIHFEMNDDLFQRFYHGGILVFIFTSWNDKKSHNHREKNPLVERKKIVTHIPVWIVRKKCMHKCERGTGCD